MTKADTIQSTTAPATATAPAADTPMMMIFSVWAFCLHYIESSPGPDEETNRRAATHSAIERLLLATPAASGEDLAALAWVTLDIAGAFDHEADHPFQAAAAALYPRLMAIAAGRAIAV